MERKTERRLKEDGKKDGKKYGKKDGKSVQSYCYTKYPIVNNYERTPLKYGKHASPQKRAV